MFHSSTKFNASLYNALNLMGLKAAGHQNIENYIDENKTEFVHCIIIIVTKVHHQYCQYLFSSGQ